MELRHLRTFAIAAEERSFTRAAQILEMTQSAASQQIAALERQLGKQFFRRVGRRVELTEDGHRLHDYARRILDLVGQIETSFCDTPHEVTGMLRVATSTVPAECVLPELLADFRALYPLVRESIAVSDSSQAAMAVEEGEADVGFVGEHSATSGLHFLPLATDELVLIVAPDHLFAKGGQASLNELRAEPLILREPGSGSRRCIEQAFDERGAALDELNIVMEVNSNEAIRAAVERGAGLAILSRQAVKHELDQGRVVAVKLRGVKLKRRLYLVTNPTRAQASPTREFIAFASERQLRC